MIYIILIGFFLIVFIPLMVLIQNSSKTDKDILATIKRPVKKNPQTPQQSERVAEKREEVQLVYVDMSKGYELAEPEIIQPLIHTGRRKRVKRFKVAKGDYLTRKGMIARKNPFVIKRAQFYANKAMRFKYKDVVADLSKITKEEFAKLTKEAGIK